MVHFAPTTTPVHAIKLAEIFRSCWVKHHGLPKVIISDRDPRSPWQLLASIIQFDGQSTSDFLQRFILKAMAKVNVRIVHLRRYFGIMLVLDKMTGMNFWMLLNLLLMIQ